MLFYQSNFLQVYENNSDGIHGLFSCKAFQQECDSLVCSVRVTEISTPKQQVQQFVRGAFVFGKVLKCTPKCVKQCTISALESLTPG